MVNGGGSVAETVRDPEQYGATRSHLDRPHDPEGRRSVGTISGWITQKASA